ncbi:PAS domain-containing protein [Micavibrio aeruginosavorus]|uniref:Putative PAS/PAC sensor protein n=1 Tax=Micavibrio aeruginosavorus EPB TaxID=349215 RepID=M4VE67_9BACT|nr:PAS domain-containing protein [Micavibrio aeruginosavorus]AGH97667.1 putative PAS/PAC sensor protein [Micavibrio aeruginosavorus EPB]
MRAQNKSSTGVEVVFHENDILVSKTDARGFITYASRDFLNFSGYKEKDLIGRSHNVVRHPDMPRSIFKIIWNQISSGYENFSYVLNLTKSGNFYWALLHVTPSFDDHGKIIGYHSTYRSPSRDSIQSVIVPLYRELMECENSQSCLNSGAESGVRFLNDMLLSSGFEYNGFILSLEKDSGLFFS